MDGKEETPKYVVTVLRDNQPCVVLNLERLSDNSSTVEGFYPDVGALEQARAALDEVLGGIDYILWKETGILPAPRDYRPPEGITELPF